jgi:hypothetical protein
MRRHSNLTVTECYFYCLHPVACITIGSTAKCNNVFINLKSTLHVSSPKGSSSGVRYIHSLIIDFVTRDLIPHLLTSLVVL